MSEQSNFQPGLVSVTFRKLSVIEVIALVAKAGVVGIEWGGDIHVPCGQIAVAKEVGRQTRDAGLTAAAYGSYYRMGVTGPEVFSQVIDTAVALGTKIVRVWAGGAGSAASDTATRDRVVADGRRISELAGAAGLTLACEWHGNTLTDATASSKAFLAAVDHPAFKTYWQPHSKMPAEQCLIDMETALPRLAGLHLFYWDATTADRRPLAEGAADWKRYLRKAQTIPGAGAGKFALLEFVRNDDPAQFLTDAAELKRWLAEA